MKEENKNNKLYKKQTEQAINNFKISDKKMPRTMIKAIGLIKACAAQVNEKKQKLEPKKATAIKEAALEIYEGKHYEQFPIDVFQTGSGTSTNMNANEVIASIAKAKHNIEIHPNDDVNMCQSSNDTIPTAIAISCVTQIETLLLPSIETLKQSIKTKAETLNDVVKIGKTHLMDAVPITFAQELHSWLSQLEIAEESIQEAKNHLLKLPQGGTALGTGINAYADFSELFCEQINTYNNFGFKPAANKMARIAGQDSSLIYAASLNNLAAVIMKISNDLRLLNSGPNSGFNDIQLKTLQPGSSIMPGKVNPVIPEACCMVAAQVMGSYQTVLISTQSSLLQLNTMLPVISYNLLDSTNIIANACVSLGELAIASFKTNKQEISDKIWKNPIILTALNPVIGYEMAAKITKEVYENGSDIIQTCVKNTTLSEKEIKEIIDPVKLTQG